MPKRPPRWLSAAKTQNRSPTGGMDWLSRVLSRAGALPPPEVEAALAAGRVRVNSQVVRQPFAPVRKGDRIELDGRPVEVTPTRRVLMFHKPAGLVCAGHDPERIGTVFEALALCLPNALRGFGWHAVGRLDRNTTGLLLFTNDEKLVARLTSPEEHLPKRYLAKVSPKATDAQLEPLRQGITLDDGPARPALAELREPGLVALTLTEGRHHQVKRMLAAVGLPVLALHREAIGELLLDVPEGEVRELSEQEIAEGLRQDAAPAQG
jgi:23S rRNA pseudouridine2605 synthase/16S rRNA pseudouridine516 synthase